MKPTATNEPAISERTARAIAIMADLQRSSKAFQAWLEEEHSYNHKVMNGYYEVRANLMNYCDSMIKEEIIETLSESEYTIL